jgi:hypothetical protein
MSVRFSIVYPTRHRPEFVRQALRILGMQRHDDFEVVVSDNYIDPALSCEQICRDSPVANLTYVRPPRPVGMIDNWNHALRSTTGDYVSFLTDKMFVLPGALARIDQAIRSAGEPDIVSWISDAYNPAAYPDYLGAGRYVPLSGDAGPGSYRQFSPTAELNRRGRADVSRSEQGSPDYCRGKVVFGAYRRDLVERVVERHGALFHNINPDYTSLVLGLAEARDAIELAGSCVVSVNTDLSNGMRSDTSDVAALGYLSSLEGGAARILPQLFVPGLYVSLHNWVAHDLLSLRSDHGLSFEFDVVNWLTYCIEDVERPGRRWSDPGVKADQRARLATFVDSLDPAVAGALRARLADRASQRPRGRSLPRRLAGRVRRLVEGTQPGRWEPPMPAPSPSLEAAVAQRFAA